MRYLNKLLEQPTLKVGCSVEGSYSFKAIKADGTERDLSEFIASDHKNMILDSGLDVFGKDNVSLMRGCSVGVGFDPVLPTQTTLSNQVASTQTKQQQVSGRTTTPPYFAYSRVIFRFGQGVAQGNLTEVGSYASNGVLISRALIVDSAGNPATLTVLPDEYLDVTYELRFYQNLEDSVLDLSMYGLDFQVRIRPSNVTSSSGFGADSNLLTYQSWTDTYVYNGAIGPITGGPTGSNLGFYLRSFTPYTDGTYKRGIIKSFGLNDANLSGGIKSMFFSFNIQSWQAEFNPPIPKDAFKTLSLTFTIEWNRKEDDSEP